LVGLTGKRYNKKTISKFVSNENEAHVLSNDKLPLRVENGYVVVRELEKVVLSDGYYPIQFMIYDLMRLRMLNNYKLLRNQGVKIWGIHTDNLFVSHIPDDLKVYDTKTLDALGHLHIEKEKHVPSNMWEIHNNSEDKIDFKPTLTEYKDVDTLRDRTIVLGLYAGAGKSTLLQKGLDPETTLFVCNTQRQCVRIKHESGFDTQTMCKFLGLRVDTGKEMQETAEATTKKYKHIVFNEIYFTSVDMLGKLKRKLDRLNNDGICVYADGDYQQLHAPCAYNNIKNMKDYLNNAIASMFPHRILLTECHRLKDPKDKEILPELVKDIFEGMKAKEVAAKYGFKVVESLEGVKEGIGLSNFNCTMLSRKINGEIKAGDKVMLKEYDNHKKDKLHINDVYTVRLVQKHTVVDDRTGRKVSKLGIWIGDTWYVMSKFRPAVFMTVHANQGSTIRNPYTIIEADTPMANANWLYTAISRAERFDDVSFYFGELPREAAVDKLQRKIESYRASDMEKGFETDVDVKWILEQGKLCNYSCCICHREMDFNWEDAMDAYQVSVDRINNELGHIKTNCKLTCFSCNRTSR